MVNSSPTLSSSQEERRTTVVNSHANIAMTRAIRLSPARGEDYGEGCFEFFRTLHLQIASRFLFALEGFE